MKIQQLEVKIQGETAEILFRRQPVLFIGIRNGKVYVAPKNFNSVEWVKQLPGALDNLAPVKKPKPKATVKSSDPIVMDLLESLVNKEPIKTASKRIARKHHKTIYQIAGVRAAISRGTYGDKARQLSEMAKIGN